MQSFWNGLEIDGVKKKESKQRQFIEQLKLSVLLMGE